MPRNPSNSQITEFITMTNCPDRTFVTSHLRKHGNNVQAAINDYFDKNMATKWGPSPQVLKTLFSKYKGKNKKIQKNRSKIKLRITKFHPVLSNTTNSTF